MNNCNVQSHRGCLVQRNVKESVRKRTIQVLFSALFLHLLPVTAFPLEVIGWQIERYTHTWYLYAQQVITLDTKLRTHERFYKMQFQIAIQYILWNGVIDSRGEKFANNNPLEQFPNGYSSKLHLLVPNFKTRTQP